MEKFNNLLNREDYIKSVNEGKIGDFLRNGVRKFKQLFSLCIKKIKGLIVLFDTNGNVLPVIMPQTIGDQLSGDGNVSFFSSEEMSKEIKEMGGKGCSTKATISSENSYEDDSPNGVFDYMDWVENEYKNSNFAKNLKKLELRLGEMKNTNHLEKNSLNEAMDLDNRAPYLKQNAGESMSLMTDMDTENFKKALNLRIKRYCTDENVEISELGDFFKKAGDSKPGNIIIFGAPGIGKSTIPQKVVEEFNEGKDTVNKISLIKVNCSNVKPGDLLMPNFPKPKDIYNYLDKNNSDGTFGEQLSFLDNLDDKQKDNLRQKLADSGQFTANNAPAAWVPCYKYGDDQDLNGLLDFAANGGKFSSGNRIKRKNKYTGKESFVDEIYATGSGGIILLDEFLRADGKIFNELLNFLLDREVDGWRLGSKWFIVACTNRPVDDNDVNEVFAGWYGAAKDRWPEMWHFNPSPEEWKTWASSKGFDETLLRFIFDEKSKHADEYPRWHSVVKGEAANDDPHKQVTPRNWMEIHKKFVEFWREHKDEERFENGYSITNMSFEEIRDVLKGVTDDDFRANILSWLEEHCGALSLDKILEDPMNTMLPISSKTNEAIVLSTLTDDIKFRNEKKQFTDEEFSKIMIWLGINYRKHFNLVASGFANRFKYMFNEKIGFWDFRKSGLLFLAAFPEEDYMEVINYPGLRETLSDKNNTKDLTKFYLDSDNENDMLEKVKSFAKEYFPWNIKNDEFISIYDAGHIEEDVNLEDE